MPVAKTYEKMTQQGEPFKENGRWYIYVLAPKGQKKVRWYSDAEYRRMYPTTIVPDIMDFNAKVAFGFGEEGFITIYQGKNVEEWANEDRTNIYYNLTFGYYTPGRLALPRLTSGITPIKLTWDEVKDHDTKMRPHEEVSKYVRSLSILDINDASTFQGEKDEWLQRNVKIKNKETKDKYFGTIHTYFMEDAQNNIYVWETGAKDYQVDKTISLKMKVKDHKEINNQKVTIVWYCKEV